MARTGWHWDESYAWHQTGAGAGFIPAGGWVQPGLLHVESSLSRTRFRDLDASAFDPLGRQLLHSRSYRQMTELLLGVARDCCDGRLVLIHEGSYSEPYVPFCGLAVLEALLGEQVVDGPFLDNLVDRPAQALQSHQDEAVKRAEALVERVPA